MLDRRTFLTAILAAPVAAALPAVAWSKVAPIGIDAEWCESHGRWISHIELTEKRQMVAGGRLYTWKYGMPYEVLPINPPQAPAGPAGNKRHQSRQKP